MILASYFHVRIRLFFEIHLLGGLISKGLVWPDVIVGKNEPSDRGVSLENVGVILVRAH